LGLRYHPTAHAHKCSNPKIYINLSILKLQTTALLEQAGLRLAERGSPEKSVQYHLFTRPGAKTF